MSHDTEECDPKKNQFLRNMHFLCDSIDVKLSVKGTFKV